MADVPSLDKERFRRTVTVPCLTVQKEKLNDVLFYLKPFLFKQTKIQGVIPNSTSDETKLVLLNPKLVKSIDDLGEKPARKLEELGVKREMDVREVELTYENLSTEDVLKELLPMTQELVSSFSIIGHIAHLNLKEHLLPYKNLIGQVILEKNKPLIRMVVNKISTIENQFRFFPMEILARDSEDVTTMVEVRSTSCRFKFDFATVYWNPRLDTEHERIIRKLRRGMDVAYDVFAGVGPFSIPLAKNKCKAVANDLNPESFRWLKENAELNKVTDYHSAYNMDGRQFIKSVLKDDLIAEWKAFDSGEECKVKRFHVIMNLPALAVNFLDAFVGLFDDQQETIQQLKSWELPVIHCYTFVKGIPESECPKAVVEEAEKVLEAKIVDVEEVKLVRAVAPNKLMYRISFKLPVEACFTLQKHKKLKSGP